MWSQLIKIASVSKGALVVGVAASAAMVSNAEFSSTPSHNEVSPSPAALVASPTPPRPANSPSSFTSPETSSSPAAQLPADAPSTTPITTSPSTTKTDVDNKDGNKDTTDADGLAKECVEKYLAIRAEGDSASHGDRESTSRVCKAAIEKSGLTSSEFAIKFGLTTVRQPAQTEPVNDVTALVKECFAKYAAGDKTTHEACKKAIAASGLSGDDFWKKFGTPTRPSTQPKTTAAPNAHTDELYQLIVTCLKLRNSLTTTSEQARRNEASAACAKAISASGMTSTDFWAKFAKELHPSTVTPTTAPTTKPVTNTAEPSQFVAKCLRLYAAISTTGDAHAASEACGAALRATGLSSADFWATYHPATN